MKANIKNLKDGINAAAHRKENSFWGGMIVTGYKNKTFKEVVTLRYYGSGSTVYACVWINGGDKHGSGSGKAGGYGYHKASAATLQALNAAGAYIDQDIAGRGDSAVQEALSAVAIALGYKNHHVTRVNG